MGKSGAKANISEYTMSIHMGICAAGPGLQLLALKYGDKEIWRGSATDAGPLVINQPTLFGDVKKEGGVKGLGWVLPGKSDQVMPATLAAKLGLTTATCPGFRGLFSVFFTGTKGILESPIKALAAALAGNPSNNKGGFYWGANNPYLRSMSARVRRPSIGLNPAIALMRINDDSLGNQQWASNPGHMIYECLTNTEWGMGENPDVIDKPTFETAAQTLYGEQFGLNMIWTRQSEIGKFIGEILTHIQAALFVNPATGKHTIKLLRGDYNVDMLPVIDASNAKLSSFKRKAWGNISNEVVVTYTNAETGKDATVTSQDLAGIAAEGGVISASQNYYAVPNETLAIKLADRDLAAMVNPIATCEATVTREFWDTVSSDVVKLSWPEFNIEQIVCRVSLVSKTNNTITLGLYEDIFGLDHATYLSAGEGAWVNPSQPPTPATLYQFGTAPAFMTAAALKLSDPSSLAYPEVLSAIIVGADSDDDIGYDSVTNVADVNGTTTQQIVGSSGYQGTWAITSPLVAEAVTVLTDLPGLRGPEPVAGNFILIGTGADEYTEIATVQSVDGAGFRINRGMLDTVPRDWPAGTRAFVIPAAASVVDPTVRSAFEATPYRILTRTTVGRLAIADAPQINVSLSERPYLPNRPANVKVNGVGFGVVDASGGGNLTVTWANRNRLLESTQAMKWTEASVAGEAGQTTKITVSTTGGTLLATYSGITGTSFVITPPGLNSVVIQVFAEKAGKTSLQAMSFAVTLPPSGFSSGFSSGFH
ncbi:phage tail protein [Mesorhizobium sp. AR07]|uniref:phage tail protein n=1 Tax=Mesorhizobium sp. AR07 TaxID=2865838 RepID=UPI002160A501|nr:phage tail protein [Mesorhizobium sp. AR07]UVK46806.1 phage tail protein [Mesorhizobium sp. AR07]